MKTKLSSVFPSGKIFKKAMLTALSICFVFSISTVSPIKADAAEKNTFTRNGIIYKKYTLEDFSKGKVIAKGAAVIGVKDKTAKDIVVPKTVNDSKGKKLNVISVNELESDAIETVKLPDGILEIGDGAFYEDSQLKSINFPSSIIEIRPSAFEYCKNLESVKITSKKCKLGDSAFSQCVKLASIEIADGINCNADDLFSGTAITSFRVPKGTTGLGEYALSDCIYLEKISIPASVVQIGSCNFDYYNYSHLKTIEYSGTKDLWKKVAIITKGNDSLKGVEIIYGTDTSTGGKSKITQFEQDGVIYTPITLDTYSNGKSKKVKGACVVELSDYSKSDIVIPDTVSDPNGKKYTVIDLEGLVENKLWNDHLKTITLPSSLLNIGAEAFMGCINLQTINIKSSKVNISEYSLDLNKLETITLPSKNFNSQKAKFVKALKTSGNNKTRIVKK